MVLLCPRRAVFAVLVCASPAFAGSVLSLDQTQFRAELAYNQGQSASSESASQPLGQSLTFTHAENPPLDSPLPFPGTQLWGLITQQPAGPLGGDPVAVEFEFRPQHATPIVTTELLTVSLGGLNAADGSPLAFAGPLSLNFEIGGSFATEPWVVPAAGWEWSPTPGGSTNEYDLVIDLGGLTPSQMFGLSDTDEINKIKVSFDLTVPEPGTFALLAAAMLLRRRRRR